jgi:hypothetical protein
VVQLRRCDQSLKRAQSRGAKMSAASTKPRASSNTLAGLFTDLRDICPVI